MSAPSLWPIKASTAFRVLFDLINGRTVWAPLATPPARVSEFDGAILQLRLLGWPVTSTPKGDSVTGFRYELSEQTRLEAVQEIKRRLAAQEK